MRKFYSFVICLTTLLCGFSNSVWAQSPVFSEGFEGGSMPTGWTKEGSGTWSVGTGDYSSSTGSANGSSYNAKITHGTSGVKTKLITPAIDLSGLSTAYLSFWHVQRSWAGDIDHLKVYYRTSSSADWKLITGQSYTTAFATWTQETDIELPDLSSTYQIAFEMTDNYGYGVGIDEVQIIPPASCPKPTLTLDDKDDESATFSWTAGGSETQWQYLYLPVATTLTDSHWSSATLTGSTSATISGLSANTSYTFYLRAYCAADDQSDPVKNTFITDCGITPLPWNYYFETSEGASASSLPACWDLDKANDSWDYGYVFSSDAYAGSQCLGIRVYGTGTKIVILPEMAADVKNSKISFYYKNSYTGSNYGQLELGYVNPASGNAFTSKTTFSKTTSYTSSGLISMQDNAPEGARLAFRVKGVKSGYYTYAFIDNIHVESTLDCGKPTTNAATNVTSSSARISWTAKAGVTSYKYIYKTSSTTPTSSDWESADTESNTYKDLTGLSAETTYYYWVMCACGTVPSDVRSFTTDAACPSVSTVTLSNKTYNGVRVNWTTSSATNCDVQYSTNGGSTWTAAGSDISATYMDITVSIGNTYTFAVKPHCGGDGAWVAAGETYTPTCPTPGALSLSAKKFNGVTISWSAVAGVSEYNLRYRKGSDSWTEVNNIAALNYTISSGLVTNEEYTIELQTECGGSYSSTTYTPEASAPAVVSVGSILETSATANWTEMTTEGAIGYQYILVARDAAVDWSKATSVNSVTFSASLTGLTLGTDYDVYVRTKYSASLYSAGKKRQFTTKVNAPTGLTKGTVTAYTAQFSWTAGGGATQYQYLCLPSATAFDDAFWSSSTLVNSTSAIATGLSANTAYKFYVRAYYNGKGSTKLSSSEFKTDCGAVSIDAEHPWTYNFNSDSYGNGVIPECWSSQRSSYSASPSYSYPYITNYSGRSSSNCLVFAGGYTYGNNDIILPPFGVALSDLALSFYYKNGTYDCTESDPQFEAGYYSTEGDPSTFISLGKLTRLSSWTKAEYDLADAPSAAKNIVIRFGFESGTTTYNSTSAYIDDIEVKLSDGCSKPVNPSCTATTRSSATLRWTSREVDSWQIQYSVNSDFSSSTTVNAATNPFTLTGLTANTLYYARVRGVCGGETTDWSAVTATFRTDCGEIASDDLPYSYGFETNTSTGSGNIPQCWKSISSDVPDAYSELYTYPYVYTVSARTGSNLLYFYGGVTSTSDEYAILPEFEDYIKDLTIEFYHKESYSDGTHAQFTVGYLTDVTDASTFVSVQAIARNTSYTQAKVALTSVPLSASNITIRFSGGSANTYGYIDDVKVYPTAAIFTNADGDGDWTNDDNWLMGAAPTSSDDAIIRKPVVIPAGEKAVAKSVVIDQINTRTGSIDIAATGELVIADTLRKVTGTVRSKTYAPTTESDLYIASTSAGNGALVIGSHSGDNKATVELYTKSYGAKEQNTSVAQYLGTPYNDETNILYNWYNSWIYRIEYTGGEIGWERVNEGEGMTPFAGYCVYSADAWDDGSQKDGGHTYWMQGTLVSTANHTCSGLNWKSGEGTEDGNNENLLANSWTAPIQISAFEAGDFVNTDAAIYIFNAHSPYGYTFGNYTTYTINTAAATATIPSMQSFSVFTNATGGSSVTLNYKRLVYDPAVAGLAIEANHAPRRDTNEETEMEETDRMQLYVTSDSEYSDVVYLIENEDCTDGFDNGWDGRKLFGESYAPQLYVLTNDGKMSVNCSPTMEGTVLGFLKGSDDNAYTFTFDYDERYEWYLNDLREQTSTRISPSNTYRFYTTDDDAARFIISRTPINYVPTAVENSDIRNQMSDVRKLLIDGTLYIIRDGRMFDATGVVVQ